MLLQRPCVHPCGAGLLRTDTNRNPPSWAAMKLSSVALCVSGARFGCMGFGQRTHILAGGGMRRAEISNINNKKLDGLKTKIKMRVGAGWGDPVLPVLLGWPHTLLATCSQKLHFSLQIVYAFRARVVFI